MDKQAFQAREIGRGQLSKVATEEARLKQAYDRRSLTVDPGRNSLFDCGNLAIVQERERVLLSLLRKLGRHHLNQASILEVGCGDGFWLSQFIQWGCRPENVFGVDILPDRISRAEQRLPATVHLHCGSATALEFADRKFDLVLCSTVFSSVLDRDVCRDIAREMLRVLKPDGLILWYDFHVPNPGNPDVRPIKKAEIGDLFTGCAAHLRRVTLAPPLARALAPISPSIYSVLSGMKFLCTHYLGVIQKP